ncbi:LolA-like putative outer membrane lipoprotein chaperone [Bacteroides helcogenes]|uniref:Outer membrane lipoprotein carrier protein LolA n=1 Tax=Bacteroides helcogenes (strain ATCC 35417 / DSM 20613 / JCM 6297 / CCUG 15421 / P 36-108) TaxID=693979 RepID=E6SVQ4_BACT6|nr:LolA-like putative outer membrane lipoprotein chaperone [Bacteroides helcogenes]ADV43515.1 hypothetical protein Bache_1510 [Bacteroides helcogenes P 36-108]MDY5239240.1 LolA-like putative outer membrane lipoprotein chaperone [Bacteroides helcogenes]
MLKFDRILLCVLLLSLSLPVLAQKPEAKDILERTTRKFREAGGIKAVFTVRTSGGATTGTIRLKGDKFLLETDGVTTWFDGHTQWSYLSSGKEVNISEPTPEELQNINPYAFLSLDEQGYKLKLGKIDNVQDNSLYKMVFTATGRKQDLQCIILYVTKDSLYPVRVSMARRGGEAIVIIINSYQTGLAYPDGLFVFDKKDYPAAEIIDLR